MKICAHLYAMNYGITYILRSMRYRMELHLITGTAAQKYLMLNLAIYFMIKPISLEIILFLQPTAM